MESIPVEKNKEYIVDIIDNGFEGEGIAKIDGYTIFIDGVIKGEKCRILIVKVTKSHGYGKLIEVIEKSKYRVEADCTTYKRCGGCNLRHIEYNKTLEMKRDVVQNLVNKILENKITVRNTIGMEKPYYYRNKAQYPFGINKNGDKTFGIYAKRTHEIIDIDDCKIQNPISKKIAREVLEFVKENNVNVYNEETGKGLLRHLIVKVGIKTNEVMCIIVLNEEKFEKEQELVKLLIEKFNKDDKNTERIINDSGIKSISLYGVGKENDIGEYSKLFTYADHINISLSDGEPGIMFSAHLNDKEGMDYEHMFVLPLPGIFSVYNSLAAVTVCDIILRERDARDRIKLMSDALCDINVRGRLEVISSDKGFMVIIDYAHNELSLRELLMAMRQYVRGKLITVFGCGGNRSRERRYKMGEVSAELSDFTVITSDNPRYEKPDDIMNDIKQGMLNVFKEDRENDERYVMIQDREKAVRYAWSCAEAGDVVIVAGKGHETYQEIMGIRHYMKDSDIVNNYLYGGYNG